MTPRIQRIITIALLTYFILIGGTFYTDRVAQLRIFHQVFTATLIVGWLVTLWRKGHGFPRTPIDLPLLVYGLSWLAAAFFAADRRISLEYAWPIFVNIMAFYFFVDLMQRGRQRWLMEGLFVVGAIVVILSIYEISAWYFGISIGQMFQIGWYDIGGLTLPPRWYRVAMAFANPNPLGCFVATLTPITISWSMTARQRDLRIGLRMLSVGFIITTLMTVSQGAWMGLLASTGILMLTWLIKAAVRQRFPQRLQPLLNPKLLIPIASIILIIASISLVIVTGKVDASRHELWHRAVLIIQDNPILGVGPFQFDATQNLIPPADYEMAIIRVLTAHNIYLTTMAEGGIFTFTVGLWLLAILLRTWLQRWKTSTPGRRHRLEGALAAFIGFMTHNLIDTFVTTALLIPLLIMAAYTISGHITRSDIVLGKKDYPRHGRKVIGAIIGIVIIAEIAFLPVHVAEYHHSTMMREVSSQNFDDALAALIRTESTDPGLHLYGFERAYILGRMANDSPEQYLEQAIAAHEQALQLNNTSRITLHNLAALYASQGRIDEAIENELAAIDANPNINTYQYLFTLGDYYTQQDNQQAALQTFSDALRVRPDLAGSPYWRDPQYPARQDMLTDIIAILGNQPPLGVKLAMHAGEYGVAADFAQMIDIGTTDDIATLHDLFMLAATTEQYTPTQCLDCLILDLLSDKLTKDVEDFRILQDLAMFGTEVQPATGMTTEQLVLQSFFVGGSRYRSYGYLAQLAETNGDPWDEVNANLINALPPQIIFQGFSTAVYGRNSIITVLPLARQVDFAQSTYEPWLRLAERFIAIDDVDKARRVYQILLNRDPYLWDVQQLQDELAN